MSDSTKRAIDSFDKDRRFRMIVESCVVRARGDFGRYIDPEHADEEAHEIALRAAAYVLQHVYEDDAELAALRIERDQYRKLAEEGLRLSPFAMTLQVSETVARTNSDSKTVLKTASEPEEKPQ